MKLIKKWPRLCLIGLIASVTPWVSQAQAQTHGGAPATVLTAEKQTHIRQQWPQSAEDTDWLQARRGFIGTTDAKEIRSPSGALVWSFDQYGFLDAETAPDTVNPLLWRHARLNRLHGLYKVVDRVFQVRGFDISNVTIVEGQTGLIIIDPLTTQETAHAALELYYQHRPRKPVVAVVYTHSHADHFGGVRAVVPATAETSRSVPIVAPSGFLEEAVSENILAGTAMFRRSTFQFGSALPRGERGFVDAGLGKGLLGGTIGLIAPNRLISKPIESLRLDGVEFVFQNTPGTEAPAEMNVYLPELHVLNVAENATHAMHNLLPLRGAQVRDANGWAKYLQDTLQQFGDRSDVLISQHMWPEWGRERIVGFLTRQRDLYKFIHDQTLRLANQGWQADEIAERIRLPESLERDISTHGLYGSLKHNVKAVYQRYLGWYNGNPAYLDPLPSAQAARKQLEYFGGADAVLQRAQRDFDKGEYRWVAQVLNVVVQAEPSHQAAREWLAKALEQLGYQAESSTWRNAYLTGALELRSGGLPGRPIQIQGDFLRALSVENIFDTLATRIRPEAVEGKTIRVNWFFSDSKESYVLNLENSALTYQKGRQLKDADVTLVLTRPTLAGIVSKSLSVPDAVGTGQLQISGSPRRLAELLGQLDQFSGDFPVVLPRSER